MIKNRNWQIFIDDILESIEKIEKYVKDKNFEEFNLQFPVVLPQGNLVGKV